MQAMRPRNAYRPSLNDWLSRMLTFVLSVLALFASTTDVLVHAQGTSFHGAPAAAQQVENPYAGQPLRPRPAKRFIDTDVRGAMEPPAKVPATSRPWQVEPGKPHLTGRSSGTSLGVMPTTECHHGLACQSNSGGRLSLTLNR